MTRDKRQSEAFERAPEAGFTLVEVLIAIVILVFGLVAVTNLFLIAGSSSMAANAGSAASAIASQHLEELKTLPFLDARLNAGGSLTANMPGYFVSAIQVPGAAGAIDVRWQIVQVQAQLKAITVSAEARGPLLAARTQARFTTLRACTDPIPSSAGICDPGKGPCCPVAP